jgi:hypothetical protein
VIHGATADDALGISSGSAGDIDGDGFEDLVALSPAVAPLFYLIRGRASWPASIDLNLSNSTITVFNASGEGQFPGTYGANTKGLGDVNGDGLDDFCLGHQDSDLGGTNSGVCYLIFGSTTMPGTMDLSTLDGNDGVAIIAQKNDHAGTSVGAAGDVNGDGYDDFLVGGIEYTNTVGSFGGGAVFLVFGRPSWGPTLNLANPSSVNAVHFSGLAEADYLGAAVSVRGGDVNGDGLDDFLMGAHEANPGGQNDAGQAFLIFGKESGWPGDFDLSTLDGSNGVRFDGVRAGDSIGRGVTIANDINGDGIPDLLLGAQWTNDNDDQPGRVYVVYGKSQWDSGTFDLNTLDGTNGFVITAAQLGGKVGRSVDACDLNGDGLSDIVTSDYRFDTNDGAGYVIYGFRQGYQQ